MFLKRYRRKTFGGSARSPIDTLMVKLTEARFLESCSLLISANTVNPTFCSLKWMQTFFLHDTRRINIRRYQRCVSSFSVEKKKHIVIYFLSITVCPVGCFFANCALLFFTTQGESRRAQLNVISCTLAFSMIPSYIC